MQCDAGKAACGKPCTCSVVEMTGSQPSPLPALQVPSNDRHTCFARINRSVYGATSACAHSAQPERSCGVLQMHEQSSSLWYG